MTLTCTNVTLRQKPLRNDRISLYLDYYPAIRNPYTMKMSRREFLGIYIYAKPKNEQQRMFNQDMLNKAEAIRCIRVQSLINEEFGFLDKNKQKVDFLAYFRTKAREKYEKWDCVYNHFEKFVGGKCTFGDVTVELCEKFRDYLLKCKQINHPNAYISRNSAAGYYSTFRALLKIAYKEKMLRENLNDFLEKIEWKEPRPLLRHGEPLCERLRLPARALRDVRQRGHDGRLADYHGLPLVLWRHAALDPRHHRRVSRPHLRGDEAPPALSLRARQARRPRARPRRYGGRRGHRHGQRQRRRAGGCP